ncbi:synergin gamma [Anabrus simplex]|uniref:synergin gamma n=1 Tax=Anabrus simplex TaxID=316456 RepID=UPI0035A31785
MMANRYPFKEPQLQQQANSIQSNVPGFSGRTMWPQQQHLNHQQLTEEQKQREYLKQQQKLRLMSAGLRKQPVSADKLIENLLEKEDTFRPKVLQTVPSVPISGQQVHGRSPGVATTMGFPQNSSTYVAIPIAPTPLSSTDAKQGYSKQPGQNVNESPSSKEFGDFKSLSSSVGIDKSQSQMPSWLSSGSPSLPALYRQVWAFARSDKGFVDTSKILPVLLTSGLPTDVLGYIWGLANRKVAGQLTEEELYIAMALVALAQSGCTFNSVSILSVLPQPPIPSLNLSTVSMTVVQEREVSDLQPDKNYQENTKLQMTTNTNVEAGDEFTDFQSAVFETTAAAAAAVTTTGDASLTTSKENVSPVPSSMLTSDLKSLSDVSVNQTFPSVVVMGNGGRGIGSRLANHSLGTPRQAKARHHKHHHHHHHRSHQLPHHNVSTPVEDEFSEFQQAKDPENGDSSDASEIFAKCVTKPVQSKTFVLKESAIRTEKRVDDSEQSSLKETNSTLPAKPVVLDISQLEKPNSSVTKSVAASKELMSIEEDKYSALRALSFTNTVPSGGERDHNNSSDDFGDFLSAELPPAEDPFNEVRAKEQNITGSQIPVMQDDVWPSSKINTLQGIEFNVDDWGSFESAQTSAGTSCIPDDIPANNIVTNTISPETVASVSSGKCGLDFSSDYLSWDLNLAVTQTTKDIENWKLSYSNIGRNVGDFDIWNSEAGETPVEKDSGLSFLGKIYDRPIEQGIGKEDLLASGIEQVTGSNSLIVEDKDDEFGDFIGPEAWSSDGKYNKDVLFENQPGLGIKEPMFDTQSVSSLELPPLALSRHGSLPSLDLKIFPQSGEKTNGHQPWDSSQGMEHQIHEWCRCVQGCLELLHSAFTTFSKISSDDVLHEVVNARKGRDYLTNLTEVYGICHRVQHSANHMMADSKQLETLFTAVDTTWSNLEQFYTKADITIDQEYVGHISSDNYERFVCGICLNNIGSDLMDQDNSLCHLEYGGQVYHASCANLWVNCVDCSLPSLSLL